MIIEKEFVPYEEALELKELGFDEMCIGAYFHPNLSEMKYPKYFYSNTGLMMGEDACTAPTYSQAFRWFREKHNVNGETPYLPNIEKYGIVASDMTIKPKDLSKNENFKRGSVVTNGYAQYSTHEEAELACLRKLIEIVKEKK